MRQKTKHTIIFKNSRTKELVETYGGVKMLWIDFDVPRTQCRSSVHFSVKQKVIWNIFNSTFKKIKVMLKCEYFVET